MKYIDQKNINEVDSDWTVLNFAIWYKLEKTFEICIKLDSNLYNQDKYGRLPLHFACLWGSFSMVKAILDKKPQQVKTKSYKSYDKDPLYFCARTSISCI